MTDQQPKLLRKMRINADETLFMFEGPLVGISSDRTIGETLTHANIEFVRANEGVITVIFTDGMHTHSRRLFRLHDERKDEDNTNTAGLGLAHTSPVQI
jgi:hypothetical protein